MEPLFSFTTIYTTETTGKLGDRPRDCASNLHNIRLLSKNNAIFQNGHVGDKTLVFGSRGVGLGLRVCATT